MKKNITKIKRIAVVAITVSASSLISFNVLTSGFIVSLSVLVMGIFIYCYKDLPGHYIAWLVAVCSPLFRWVVLSVMSGSALENMSMVLPDAVFFLGYGALYAFIYKYIIKGGTSLKNFFYIAFFCDWAGNIFEVLTRSLIQGQFLLSPRVLMILAMVAIFRTALVQFVNVSVEYYTNFLVKQEQNEMFKKLLVQASVFESEVRLMEKNVDEIEVVMKKAYDLHKYACETDMPKEMRSKLLDIAKSAHEIKGDYMNVISTLKDVYINELKGEGMLLSEVISLEKQNIVTLARSNGCTVSVSVKLKVDYDLKTPFKLMSVIRNLLTNSLEAFQDNNGKIRIAVEEDMEEETEEHGIAHPICRITVSDNGCGIEKENLEFISMEGYSTKFDHETGNIHRGLGLTVVKDIVENEYGGRMNVESIPGKGTAVILTIPAEILGEKNYEILYSR